MGDNLEDAAAAFLGLDQPKPAKSKAKKKKKKKKAAQNAAKQPANAPKSKMAQMAAQHLEKKRQEQAAKEAAEAEAKRVEELERAKEEAARKAEEDRKRANREKKKARKEALRKAGKAVSKSQKAKAARARAMREQLIASGRIKVDESGAVVLPTRASAAANKTVQVEAQGINKDMSEKSLEVKEKCPSKEISKEDPSGKEEVTSEEKEVAKQSETNEPNSEQPLVSNWEELGDEAVDNWENMSFDKQTNDEIEEVVVETYEVAKPQKKKTKKPTEHNQEVTTFDESTASQTLAKLRAPICCVMGHVDTGKTKILDKLRKTNVQDNEAGGITQQIGATHFPMETLMKLTSNLSSETKVSSGLPGVLMIDTPGHESFSNLRKRGSTLCDIAILIVDLMHGLEQQTIESLNLLREKKTPFVVALNKIDRLYDWQPIPDNDFRESLAKQQESVRHEFENRTQHVKVQLMEQGLNSELYYENKDYKSVINLVPTSAHTGEGVPDLLFLLLSLSEKLLSKKLTRKKSLECSVMEVKKVEGVGTTIDVLLVNGSLKEGDDVMVATMGVPVITQIRALLTPKPLCEMRVKSEFVHHKEIFGSIGVKLVAQGLEEAIAGTKLVKIPNLKDRKKIRHLEKIVMEDYETIIQSVDASQPGVCVQASTLGSLEALIEFLRSVNIPVSCVTLGSIHKKDVMRASVMLESKPEFATILAFDVKVTKDAQELCEELGVKIFTAEIIYHLFDQFSKYMEEIRDQKKVLVADAAVFPCVLRIMKENVFMKKSPLVFGVEVIEGIVKVGTPIVVPDKIFPDPDNPDENMMLSLGKITSIERDHKEVERAKRGSKVCIKIEGNQSESHVQYGRHFDHNNALYSKLSRASIDSLKANFKDELEKTDWLTVIKLKKTFGIN